MSDTGGLIVYKLIGWKITTMEIKEGARANKEVITFTLKVISATTKMILATEEVIIVTLIVISATKKSYIGHWRSDHSHFKSYLTTKVILATNKLVWVTDKVIKATT